MVEIGALVWVDIGARALESTGSRAKPSPPVEVAAGTLESVEISIGALASVEVGAGALESVESGAGAHVPDEFGAGNANVTRGGGGGIGIATHFAPPPWPLQKPPVIANLGHPTPSSPTCLHRFPPPCLQQKPPA